MGQQQTLDDVLWGDSAAFMHEIAHAFNDPPSEAGGVEAGNFIIKYLFNKFFIIIFIRYL